MSGTGFPFPCYSRPIKGLRNDVYFYSVHLRRHYATLYSSYHGFDRHRCGPWGFGATIATVMSNLDNPRGLAFGPEGGLYVVEA